VQYQGGTEVKKLKIINTAELEIEAEKILPKGGYGYIFGGSGAEYTKRENLRAMESIGIEPHFPLRRAQARPVRDDPRA
jgi:lactate oxidase